MRSGNFLDRNLFCGECARSDLIPGQWRLIPDPLSVLAFEGVWVVVAGRGGAAVFDSSGGAGFIVVEGLLAVDSGGSWGVGDGRLAFAIGGKSRVGMSGGGDVGCVVEVRVLFVIAAGFAAGDEGCGDGGSQRQS